MPNNPFIGVVNAQLPEPHASLLNGILWGVRGSMPKDLYEALTNTGMLHVIALSGINISILIALTARSTVFIGRKASSIFTISLIVLFVWFVGASPSIVRAAIMGSFSLLAICFGRQNWSMLSLFFAGTVMLIYDNSLLSDMSFQLSFLATFGILLGNRLGAKQRELNTRKNIISILKNNITITLHAQIFTVPLIAYHFHRISLISPVVNVLTEWTMQPIMIAGGLTALIGWAWMPLAVLPSWVTWVFLTYFIYIVKLFSSIPLSSIMF